MSPLFVVAIEKEQSYGDQALFPAVYTDYRNLSEEGNLDAVVVSTPDDLHFQMNMDTLDASLHVLCEKTLALNTQQVGKCIKRRGWFTNQLTD